MIQDDRRPEGGVGAGDASSGGGIPLPPETDQQVTDAVYLAFFLDPDLSERACDVVTISRVVHLHGVVASNEQKQHIERVVSAVQGVERVVSRLQVVQIVR